MTKIQKLEMKREAIIQDINKLKSNKVVIIELVEKEIEAQKLSGTPNEQLAAVINNIFLSKLSVQK